MLAHEMMSSPVIGILPTASIKDAAKMMLASRVSGLPVNLPHRGYCGRAVL